MPDILAEPMDVAGWPVRIYPPSGTNPYHRITYRDDSGRHTTSGGRTATEATEKAGKIVARLSAGAHRAGRTVGELLDAWKSPDRPRPAPWSAKYAVEVDRIVAKRLRPYLGRIVCQDLRRSHIQTAVNAAPTPNEGKLARKTLGAALRWGQAHGWLTVAPETLLGDVHYAGAPAVVREQGADALHVDQEDIPTADAVAALYAAWHNKVQNGAPTALAVYTAAYTGLRLGELRALRGSDINTANRQVRVERQAADVRGRTIITDPKGRKRRTTVYPARTPQGFELADAIRARSRAAGDGLMFPAPRGGIWSCTNWYRRRFHPAAEVAEWPTGPDGELRWTWHDLRHVFATYYLWELHASAADVSAAIGHSTTDITLRVYASHQTGALDRLGALG